MKSRGSKKVLGSYQSFDLRKYLLIAAALAIGGVGLVLVTRASVPVYTTDWGFWGPRIKGCESGSGAKGGGNYTAQNRTSTASGAYQFLDSTWAGYGGYEKARLAPPDVQEQKAYETFKARGTQPWDASYPCWGNASVPVPQPVQTILTTKQAGLDLEPLIPGEQDIINETKQVQLVSTPPADGLDPYLSSPLVQFLRRFGFLRS